MSDTEFKVVNARPGTENQRKFGILATFGLQISIDGVYTVSLSDLKLSKSKAGKLYIGYPYREFTNKDGEKAKAYYTRLFPDERDGDSTQAIIEQVKRECDAGGSVKSNPSPRASTSSTPSPKAPPKASGSKTNSDW